MAYVEELGCTLRYWYWRSTGSTDSWQYTGEVLGVLTVGSILAKYWEYWQLAVYWQSTGSTGSWQCIDTTSKDSKYVKAFAMLLTVCAPGL